MSIEADYLVIGAGATAMAFVDELLRCDRAARVVMVDRRATPGGHWNDAYPFVRLHQPALYYGVNSEPLGAGGQDLVSKGQILGYYDRVLQKLLRTERLTFLPQTEHLGAGRVRSLVAPDTERTVRYRRLVDASYSGLSVPSTTPPRYAVEPGVDLVPVNGVAALDRPRRRYVVIGAGKTGIDAALYLLAQGVQPAAIQWVVSRDAWLLNRDLIQPRRFLDTVISQIGLFQRAESAEALCLAHEADGFFLRLDPSRAPTAYRCATVSAEELALLRSLKDVVRLGRAKRITPHSMQLDRGDVPVERDTLFVDCTADGLPRRDPVPIFQGDRITLQSVMSCQPTFSAALIAKVETRFADDARRNHFCLPVPHPKVPADVPSVTLATMINLKHWSPALVPWLLTSRLNAGSHAGLWANLVFTARAAPRVHAALENLRRLSEDAPPPRLPG